MKKLMVICFLFLAGYLAGQNNSLDYYLSLVPHNIEPGNSEIQKYQVQLKWQNLDALNGTLFNCNKATATYTVNKTKQLAKWNDVYLGVINDFQDSSVPSSKLPVFDNWEYKIMDTTFLMESFYNHIPANQQDLAKWLVSDGVQMHGLAMYVFDSLQFNQPFIPALLNDYDIQFENWVTFTSRSQKLTWSGVTKFKNEVCAIVKFESLYNPVSAEKEGMKFKGRSLYWGEMWISLSDKEVEYSYMIEDVVLELDSPAFPQKQLINLQRDVIFEKVQ